MRDVLAGVDKKLSRLAARVVKLEPGEHNPEVDTIINAVWRLGIEFVLDVAPASRKPALVTARAQKPRANRPRQCLGRAASFA